MLGRGEGGSGCGCPQFDPSSAIGSGTSGLVGMAATANPDIVPAVTTSQSLHPLTSPLHHSLCIPEHRMFRIHNLYIHTYIQYIIHTVYIHTIYQYIIHVVIMLTIMIHTMQGGIDTGS